MTPNLVLIASYPKSGNTWVRLLLETVRRDAPVSINDIRNGLYGAPRRRLFDMIAPAEASELLAEEIEELLPDFYASLADDGEAILKVHDRLRRTPSGRWLFPPECVKHVIYVVRHPFDVAVSYAHHRGITIPAAVALLANGDHVIAPYNPGAQLMLVERPSTWSGNVASWLDGAPYPVTLVRYEDLFADPEPEIFRLAQAAELPASEAVVAKAIASTRFARLQAEEAASGFWEGMPGNTAFFRQGRPGSWREVLDEASRQTLLRDHGAMMARLGYGTGAA
jgi:hypothetical protein